MSFVVKRRTEPIVYSMPVGGLVYYIPLKTDFVEKIKNATVVKTGTCTVGVDGFVANGASGLVYNIPELNVMTVSFCLKATATPLTINAYTVGWPRTIMLFFAGGTTYYNYYRAVGYSGSSAYNIITNKTVNILCTMDGTTCNYYQDGVKVGSRTSGGAALNTKNLCVAMRSDTASYKLNDARIKHVRIWNRVLSQNEIFAVKDNDNPN